MPTSRLGLDDHPDLVFMRAFLSGPVVAAGVDSIEHEFGLEDEHAVTDMAGRGTLPRCDRQRYL